MNSCLAPGPYPRAEDPTFGNGAARRDERLGFWVLRGLWRYVCYAVSHCVVLELLRHSVQVLGMCGQYMWHTMGLAPSVLAPPKHARLGILQPFLERDPLLLCRIQLLKRRLLCAARDLCQGIQLLLMLRSQLCHRRLVRGFNVIAVGPCVGLRPPRTHARPHPQKNENARVT